ncbi:MULTISPECIES: pyridoxamine 5'-phosphate oxidase family protein [Cyanophyceae]|uniref:pyridoxamine 5'-phosphate oxidase family protein n=1 Tax=Cyanophyceae TaxID=3028117 RepID=UPI001687A0D2|nr:pyridoxamine 5'-phosphate oxidase family protein [Trichocoleus sp. FACHB-69]MBD1932284.1 pyridoxamine 5'-phosphate oxidase family protein [Trichocoleus sp. FACHB-69]
MDSTIITSLADLREIYGYPSERVRRKCLNYLDVHCRNLIAAAPFLVIGSSHHCGAADVSPRGDFPGFVRVLDNKTLLIPDRPGNNRIDTLSNIIENPNVALLFLIPGMNETLRVNGIAKITQDPSLLLPSVMHDKIPKTAILVTVTEAFLHCAKALIRSRLWDSTAQIERSQFPSAGQIQAEQIGGLDVAAVEAEIEELNRSRLY